MTKHTSRLGSGRLLDLGRLLGGDGGLIRGDNVLLATELVEELLATGLRAVLGGAGLALGLGASGTLGLGIGALLRGSLGRGSEGRRLWSLLELKRKMAIHSLSLLKTSL